MKKHWRFILLLCISAMVLFMNVGSYGLIESSDARYADIARAMYLSGDYMHPNLMDVHHYHNPPPFTYQITLYRMIDRGSGTLDLLLNLFFKKDPLYPAFYSLLAVLIAQLLSTLTDKKSKIINTIVFAYAMIILIIFLQPW